LIILRPSAAPIIASGDARHELSFDIEKGFFNSSGNSPSVDAFNHSGPCYFVAHFPGRKRNEAFRSMDSDCAGYRARLAILRSNAFRPGKLGPR
jgi:hypothetical protein